MKLIDTAAILGYCIMLGSVACLVVASFIFGYRVFRIVLEYCI